MDGLSIVRSAGRWPADSRTVQQGTTRLPPQVRRGPGQPRGRQHAAADRRHQVREVHHRRPELGGASRTLAGRRRPRLPRAVDRRQTEEGRRRPGRAECVRPAGAVADRRQPGQQNPAGARPPDRQVNDLTWPCTHERERAGPGSGPPGLHHQDDRPRGATEGGPCDRRRTRPGLARHQLRRSQEPVRSDLGGGCTECPGGVGSDVPASRAQRHHERHPDTGYRRHPEIAANLLIGLGRDLFRNDDDPEDELQKTFAWQNGGHGTGTASVIVSPRGAADGNPQNAVSGTAPHAKLVPFRVSDSVVVLDTLNLARAIELATDRGVHVISISMGGLGSDRLHDAVVYATSRGVIVLAAAGPACNSWCSPRRTTRSWRSPPVMPSAARGRVRREDVPWTSPPPATGCGTPPRTTMIPSTT